MHYWGIKLTQIQLNHPSANPPKEPRLQSLPIEFRTDRKIKLNQSVLRVSNRTNSSDTQHFSSSLTRILNGPNKSIMHLRVVYHPISCTQTTPGPSKIKQRHAVRGGGYGDGGWRNDDATSRLDKGAKRMSCGLGSGESIAADWLGLCDVVSRVLSTGEAFIYC